jgi:flagellar capping protein FliD
VLAADFGIISQKDGTLKFDKTIFLAKLAADPDAAERLFNRHGSSSGGVAFSGATDGTSAGTYSVEVTTAARRATTGTVLVGGSVAGQRIGVRVGTTTVNYDAAAGASAADIATGLNGALAQAGLNVTAETSGGGFTLTATKFGYAGNFESNLDVNGAGSWDANAGADVQGKINGQVAIGSGQHLSLLSLGTNSARGIAVDIDEGLSGVLPNVEYQPGVAARLSNLGANLTGTLGVLTTSTGAYEAKVRDFNDQIDKFEARLKIKEANYRRQWTAVQNSLNSLQNQQSWLTQQTNSLNAKSG